MTEDICAQDRQDFGITDLVNELRQLRTQSLASRRRKNPPPKLPSKKILGSVIDNLSAVLFPNRLGLLELTAEGTDYFVGQTLDSQLRELYKQIRRELQYFDENQDENSHHVNTQALELTRQFAKQLPDVRVLLETDIQAAYEGDPAARSPDEVLVCYPGITAIIHHRLAHILYRLGLPLVARIISEIAHSITGIDIHPGAQIGESFFIDHGTGVVIGETAIIGRRVRLYQAVTLGAKRFTKDTEGMLVKGIARHPIVEDDVVIYAGATILGRITIGRGSTIGGNVWLTYSVAENSRITQALMTTEPCAGASSI
ncbi:MAG: serine acetyltransferase [Methylobacter sp.]|nr:MAG: serine acetyltransferase [Methylobacter sp.]